MKGTMNNPLADPTEQLRSVERTRIQALVSGDMAVARLLHSPAFQIITAIGENMSRDEYLSAVESGTVQYVRWEPGDIAVRFHGDAAVLRYQARREVIFGGSPMPPASYWHTDLYELTDGAWRAVWSHITEIY
ncbi:nuclear transport factor 2 family protein [Arthrobacter sp. 24S4-2]|nr:nuclear transport factor 2 family protein [Arthrobacter sp. 24S4-2]